MYGVTLAFSLFLVRQDYSDAQRTTEREANDVEGLYRLAIQKLRDNEATLRGC